MSAFVLAWIPKDFALLLQGGSGEVGRRDGLSPRRAGAESGRSGLGLRVLEIIAEVRTASGIAPSRVPPFALS